MDDLTRLALAGGAGDPQALASFVRRTQPEVWRLCRYLGDRDAADDLTQETYLRALAALPRFRGESSARTWILAIARRTAADAVRHARRRRSLPMPRVVHGPDPSDANVLEAVIAGLDPDRRTAFVATQVLGLSYAEAAEVCGVPIGTIRSRVARARVELVASIEDRSTGT